MLVIHDRGDARVCDVQMVHGGTNFGFYSGANIGSEEFDYKPDLTSYDYVRQFHIITYNLNSKVV